MTEVLIAILALAAGLAVGFIMRQSRSSGASSGPGQSTASSHDGGEGEAQISARSQEAADRLIAQAEEETKRLRSKLDDRERGFQNREEALGLREEALSLKESAEATLAKDLRAREAAIEQRLADVDAREAETLRGSAEAERRKEQLMEERELLDQAMAIQRRELERVAQMTAQEAKTALVATVVDEAKRHAMSSVREIEERAREEGDTRARRILSTTIQRIASETTTEATTTVFHLPSEEMKGRIIGREGRNIRSFEAVTGVNIVIDDTHAEAVVLSSFDPVRREVGRLTLEKLVGDGRIQPVKIEEMFERSQVEIKEEIKRAGEAALLDVGITDIHPEMIKVLGQLKYRTSYGQNVLRHLVESAHLAAGLSAELGVDPTIPVRGAFLHDIGKALTHEVEGSHAMIGAELARRLDESPEVVHIIESHHGEVEPRTLEAVLAQTADQISGGRPGARRESLESYVKRLERLEEICTAHPGVERAYALQAGREIRVIVRPEEVDDIAAQVLARDIAKQVEEELQYPGQIHITVIREVRAEEYAK